MASLSELASVLQTSPAQAFRQEDTAYQQYQLQQQKLQQAQQSMAPKGLPGMTGVGVGGQPQGLGAMAGNMLGPQYKLTTPDGELTSAGLVNQTLITAQTDQQNAQSKAQEAQYFSAMGDNKAAEVADMEARRYLDKAQRTREQAQKLKTDAKDDFMSALYRAKSQQDYDQRLKDAIERTGVAKPEQLPDVWTPELKDKFLSKMSPTMRQKTEAEDRAEAASKRAAQALADKERKNTAADQNNLPKQPVTKVVDGKVVPTTFDDALANPKYGVATGKVSTDDKKVARRVNTDSQLILSSLDDVSTLNENGSKSVTGTTFSNLPDKGLLTAPAKALSNNMSDTDAQMYDSILGPATREMVQFLMPDYRPTDAAFQKTEAIYKGRSGEPHIVQIQKLAKLRQDYENAGKSYLDAGIMNAEQAKEFKANVLKSRQMIPYSVKDVVEFKKQMDSNPDLTIEDFLKSRYSGKPTASTESKAEKTNEGVPSLPQGVPSSAQYSPSQKKWWWQENGQWKSQ